MREFSVFGGNITLSGASQQQSLIGINPPAAPNMNIELLRYWLGQSGGTTSAQQRIQLCSKASAWPSMTGVAPQSLKFQDPNGSVIGSATATSQCIVAKSGINAFNEGAGTQTVLWEDAFNVLNGWLHVATPPETRIFPASYTSMFEMYMPSTPSNSVSTGWAFGAVFREV